MSCQVEKRPVLRCVKARLGRLFTGRNVAAMPLEQGVGEKELPVSERCISQHDKEIEHGTPAAIAQLQAFNYMVSHELRAKLRVMHGLVRLLHDELPIEREPTVQYGLTQLDITIEQTQTLITELLELAASDARPVEVQRLDLSALAQEVVSELRISAPTHSIYVDIESGITALGEPTLIRQVLENLLSNAWKFTRDSRCARVGFGMERENGEAVFYVRDNGVGIPLQQASLAFEPFVRLGNAQDIAGTGIGLYTVRRIVERHNGRVWVAAGHAPGVKICFTLAAPAPLLTQAC